MRYIETETTAHEAAGDVDAAVVTIGVGMVLTETALALALVLLLLVGKGVGDVVLGPVALAALVADFSSLLKMLLGSRWENDMRIYLN